jgi:glycosyltransferase involved in cell wall biosynthesis
VVAPGNSRLAYAFASGAARRVRLLRMFLGDQSRAAARSDLDFEGQRVNTLACRQGGSTTPGKCSYPYRKISTENQSSTRPGDHALLRIPTSFALVLVGLMRSLVRLPISLQTANSETRLMTRSPKQKPSYIFILPWELNIVGGVNGVVRNLAKEMMEKGSLKPSIAVNSWEDSTPRKSASSFRFRFSIFGSMSALGLLKAIALAPLRLSRTFVLLREYNATAVNFHFPGIAPFGVAVLKRLRVFRGKLILSYHGTDVAAPSGRIETLIRDFVLRSADHLVACSENLAERMSLQFAIPISRIDVIFNGVDASVFDGIGRPDMSFPSQLPSTFILNVGTFIPRKNYALLVNAFALLKDRFPALHLCIAGADGVERPAIEQAVRAHGLSERVHLFLDLDQFQVASLLAKATLCIQTSLAESFPLAILEAGASGIPIVASDIPGHRELVCNGKTGSLFPLGDASACANAIGAMLDDPGAAKRMAEEHMKRVRKDRTWLSCMQQYERLACST